MNRSEIRSLQEVRGYPAVTITLPTHRVAPANRQDPIRIRNLVTQAANRLLEEFTKREIEPLLDRLERLAESVDLRHSLDGLVLFANRDSARFFRLPFSLRERVVVDETFFTRDLVFAMNRTPRYWALALSEKPTRLFEGTRESLIEIKNGGFPIVYEGSHGEEPLPRGFGVRKSVYENERHRQFFRKVDAAFKPFQAEDPLPIAVAGVERHLAYFHEVTNHRGSILAAVTGSHDKTSAHELGKLVWSSMREAFIARRREVLSELEKAAGERKLVSTVGEVWRLANEGRGRLLLVEEGFSYPARVDKTGMRLDPAEDLASPGVVDDAVDEIVETVLGKQGEVVFVDDGRLAEHGRIALIVRY